jgi:hypothetical protein
MKNEPRLSIKEYTDELPPEVVEVQRLKNENAALRIELKHLRSTVRTVAAVVRPYAANGKR